MIQILNKNGATNSDDANVIILDKNGNVRKIGETSGTVTSIFTASPITGGTITSSGTIGITQSNTSTDGYLSSTDWNTFNNKQNALINPITGTGANGQVAFFNGATTQTGDNGLFWNNTNKRLGIGTNAPTVALDVVGSIRSSNSFTNAIGLSLSTVSGRAQLYQAQGVSLSYFNGSTTVDGLVLLNTGNVGIGTTNPQARLDVRAQGALSTDTAFRVRNSADTANLFTIDGLGFANSNGLIFRTDGFTAIVPTNDGFIPANNGNQIRFTSNLLTSPAYGYHFQNASSNLSWTSGTGGIVQIRTNYAPTSGTGVFNVLNLQNTINQTGGANGITRGLFINPTLTAAADWRAIEVSSGGAYINTTSVQASAILQADSTTRGFLLPRMTTAQRDAIVSPSVGLQIFNTTAGYLEYFDSFWGWMPIDNSNDWKRRNGTEYFNDFGQNNTFSDGVFQTFPINGGGALSFNPTPNLNDYIGLQGLSTGVNTNGANSIRTDVNIARFFNFNCGRKSFISRLWIQTLSTITDRYNILNGFSNGTNSTVSSGAAFIYDEGGVGTGTTASPNWQIITANGGVRTNFVTSVVVNTSTWYSFRIESNANDTEIYYYINDILVRTETTNIPGVGVANIQPFISITKNAGTTNRGIAVDYLGLKIKLNNQR